MCNATKGIGFRLGALFLAGALAACGQATHELSDPESAIDLLKPGETPFEVEGEPFTGKVIARHSKDQLAAEMEFKKGRPHGSTRFWHENGQLRSESEGHWDEDVGYKRITGMVKRWNAGGKLEYEAAHNSDGEKHGEQTTYCADSGKPQQIQRYADGALDGATEAWDCSSGQRIASLSFEAGKLDGEVLRYFADGKSRLKAEAQSGALVGTVEAWHANGQLAERGTAIAVAGHPSLNFRFIGLAQSPSGVRSHETLQQMAALTGEYQRWEEDGTLALQAYYDAKGEPTGTWRERNSSGVYDRQDYDRGAYVSDEYAPAIAKALNSHQKDGDALFYYLEQKLVRADQRLAASFNVGMFGNVWLTYEQQSQTWPRRHWSYPVHGIGFEHLPKLLAAGAAVDARDSLERTRLILCAQEIRAGRCTAAEIVYLLAQKADPSAVDGEGRNALRALGAKADGNQYRRPNPAVEHAQALDALLAAGAALDARDRKGNTLLIDALAERKTELAKKLIDAGADVNTANHAGNAPIHFVFLTRDDSISFGISDFTRELLPMLIAKGANVDQPFNWDDGKPITLRNQALKYGDIKAVQLLEAHGAAKPTPL